MICLDSQLHSLLWPVLAQTSPLRPINPSVRVPWTWWHLGLAITALALASAVGWGLWQRIQNSSRFAKRDRRQLLARRAIQLHTDWLGNQLSNGQAVEEAAAILRCWLVLTFGAKSGHFTTQNWAAALRKRGVGEQPSAIAILHAADLYKFAAHTPDVDDVRNVLLQLHRCLGITPNN